MKRKLKKYLVSLTEKLDRHIYKNKDFVIISNNCWGGEIYNRLGLKYNTPFIGLFIYGPDYIKLLENFDDYMNYDLHFILESKWNKSNISYPIGLLNDIEVHFMHYKNENEALTKWNRRLTRMKNITNKDKYYLKICDRDLTDLYIINRFHKLPFKNKISFGIKNFNQKNHFQLIENENNLSVPDGVSLYRHSNKYIDVLKWVNSGAIEKNFYSKIKSTANILYRK
ncbi:MAG: DUF1919 domain-containing protein [Winogradskyella arenosi]